MPLSVCPSCRRVNPVEAVYCHHDGMNLRSQAEPRGTLGREFVFASGRRCRSFDDFVQGCQYEWEEARDLLRQGAIANYFTSLGRRDLARQAAEAAEMRDPDIALHEFLTSLPVQQVQGPRLELAPRRLLLRLGAGERREVPLTISNSGKGILQGKLSLEGGPWIRFDGETQHVVLKAPREQLVKIRVDSRSLKGPNSYLASIVLVTNGGVAEVPVRLDIEGMPFQHAPYQGVASPRELAERMVAQPDSAEKLLQGGQVEAWFRANRWRFPVHGPIAPGKAAVQQFLESMALTRPPEVRLAKTDFQYSCVPPEILQGKIVLVTKAKKLVYATAESDVAWLRLPHPTVSGAQKALLPFEIDSSLMDEGRPHRGLVSLVANGGVCLEATIIVHVQQGQEPLTRRFLRPFLGEG